MNGKTARVIRKYGNALLHLSGGQDKTASKRARKMWDRLATRERGKFRRRMLRFIAEAPTKTKMVPVKMPFDG